MKRKFRGGWEYLQEALFEISEARAERACMELALFLRMVDDEEAITEYHKATESQPKCGRVVMLKGPDKDLIFREAANKVIHSSRLEWKFSDEGDPVLVAHAGKRQVWARAEIDLVALAAVCSTLAS